MVIRLGSLLKSCRIADAREYARNVLETGFVEVADTEDILARISAHAIVTEISNRLESTKADWSEFDPFGLWRSEQS